MVFPTVGCCTWTLKPPINGRVKLIKVRGRGFHNKERFRNAIYFHLDDLDLYPEALRT